MALYDTDKFLASVRQRGALPTTSNTNNVNSTANLLALATEELHIKLLPLIMSTREEFYVTETDFALVAGTAKYSIPTRASGLVLRDLQIISGNSIQSLPPIDPEVISTTSQGAVEAYYLQHNKVVLYPTPGSSSDTLRMRYFARPSRLAAILDCAKIISIDTDTSTVTVSTVPSTWGTGTVVDFVSADIPYQCRAIDQVILTVSGADITFTSLPADLAAADWVAPQEYSPIPQVPQEFQPVLAQMTVVKALQALGDEQAAATAQKDLDILQQNALLLVTPRNQGETRKIINRNWRRR